MIAFKVPVGWAELLEASFFSYPLHNSRGFGHELCYGCRSAMAEHDPGDEDPSARDYWRDLCRPIVYYNPRSIAYSDGI